MTNLLKTRTLRSLAAALAALGTGAVLGACASAVQPGAASSDAGAPASSSGSPSPSSSPVASPTEDPAAGGSDLRPAYAWVVESVTGHEIVPGTEIILREQEGRLSVSAGCNQMGGTLTDNGDTWTVSEMAQTEMACDEARMAQDTWVADLLAAGPAVTRTDTGLVLTAGDNSMTLVERAAASLTDTTWELTGLISGDSVSSLPATATSATMTIVDGMLSLTGLCNGVGGEVTIVGDQLTVELGPATLMSCGTDLDAAEAHAQGVLNGTTTVVITDQSMTVTAADGTGLQFVVQA